MNARPIWLRHLLATLVLAMLLAVSCAPGFDPPSKVSTVRILSVTIDKPYALAGDEVTFRMTVHDGLPSAQEPGATPRPLQILWLAGCVDPEGDQYYLCYEQLAEVLAPLAQGGLPDPELVKLDVVTPELSGAPDALEFTTTLPDDIVTRRPVPKAGPHYGIAYIFFAACAGQLAPADLASLGGEVPEFPLECHDSAGNKLGPDSFIIGYTQVYAFSDERLNTNPPVPGLAMDGIEMSEDPTAPVAVKRCDVNDEDRRQPACASENPTDDCIQYTIKAMLGDLGEVAELDPDAYDLDGNQLREVVWVSYFGDGGDFDPSLALVNDATQGFQDAFETTWIPPREPGLYRIWAVLRDQRGGSTVVRRFVQVD